MHRQLSVTTTLDHLKKEAKRWLKALRANDAQARERLQRAYPQAPDNPGLREVQRALAFEYGFAGWTLLKRQLEAQSLDYQLQVERVNLFLEAACADPILANGPAAHAGRSRAALRMLKRYPEIAHANLHAAVVCGEVETVSRILQQQPEAATARGGPLRKRQNPQREKLWTPLLHLCFGRLPTAPAADNAVAIARMLLDHGANPNDYFEVGTHPDRYSALCGVIGEGEDDAPPHPQREALVRLLLERGAEPYDIQVLYNTHFHGDILWLIKLLYEAAVRAGRQADWDDPNWTMIDMGGLNFGARYLMLNAVKKNDLKLADWLLQHGASPNAVPKPNAKLSQQSLHEEASQRGFAEMADLLVRFGATPSAPITRTAEETFTATCFRLDRAEAEALLASHPEFLHSSTTIFQAARQDRVDVIRLLLELGTPIEIENEQRQRPLHEAASHDALNVAHFLIECGAKIDPVEANWGATPLSFAIYGQKTQMVELLSRHSHDIWQLTQAGQGDRLKELLHAKPKLAKVTAEGTTPLMWLPNDEAQASEIVELFLAYGADPGVRNKAGMTAADCAEKQGLYAVADLLRAQSS